MLKIADDIIKKFGLQDLPPEEQKEMVEKFSDVVLQAVIVRGLAQLSEEQKDELDVVLQKDPEDPMLMVDFFIDHLPNFETIVKQQIDQVMERAKIVAE